MQGTGPLFGVTPLVWKEGWQVCGDKGNPILGTLCICWLTIAAETYQMRETSLRTRNSLTLLKKNLLSPAFISCTITQPTQIPSLSLIPSCGSGGCAQRYGKASDDDMSGPHLLFLFLGFPLTPHRALSFLLCLQEECERQGWLLGEQWHIPHPPHRPDSRER